jgi:hypothetical protein
LLVAKREVGILGIRNDAKKRKMRAGEIFRKTMQYFSRLMCKNPVSSQNPSTVTTYKVVKTDTFYFILYIRGYGDFLHNDLSI